MHNPKKAVVILSGGIDSSTCMAIASKEGFSLYPISFNYGQKNLIELRYARKVAKYFDSVQHTVIKIDNHLFKHSSLTNPDLKIPTNRPIKKITSGEIPSTYVPVRNLLFLSYALALCEMIQSGHIFLGANAVDFSGYPDCRPEFINSFREVANLATKMAVEKGIKVDIVTPLINEKKSGIIKLGIELGVDYGITWSCYQPTERNLPCRRCDSCTLRAKGFAEAGLDDPLMKRLTSKL